MNDDTLFLPGLSPVERHDIHARFDGGALSSDGGVLLLREIERGVNFSGMLASCLHDARDPGRMTGVGFTMSLFIGSLAFGNDDTMNAVRLGVVAGSVLSGLLGFAVLRTAAARPTASTVPTN